METVETEEHPDNYSGLARIKPYANGDNYLQVNWTE